MKRPQVIGAPAGSLARLLCILLILLSNKAIAEIRLADDSGRTVTLAQPAKRIITLAPHIVELLYAAGAGDRIVGAVEYSYFPEAAKATAFADWLGKNGYLVEKVEALEETKHGVRFSHQGTVELSDISRHTITLRRQVSEMSGEYDGWETQVCTAKEVQTAAGH